MFLYAADKDVGGSTNDTERGTETDTERENTSVDRNMHNSESHESSDTRENQSTTETSESTSKVEDNADNASKEESADNIAEFEEKFTPEETDEKKTARKTVEDVFKEAKDLSTSKWLENEKDKEKLGKEVSRSELMKKLRDIASGRAEASRAYVAGEMTRDEKAQVIAELDERRDAALKATKSWLNMVHEIEKMTPEEISKTVEERKTLQDDLTSQLRDIREQREKDKNNEELKRKEEETTQALNKVAIDTANAIEEIQNKLGINPSRQTATWSELVDYYQQPGRQSGFWTAVGAFVKSAGETIKQGINPFDEQSKLDRVTKEAAALRSAAETIIRINRAETVGKLNLESELRTRVPFNTEDGLNIAFMATEDPTMWEQLKAGIQASVNRNWYVDVQEWTAFKSDEIEPLEEEYLAATKHEPFTTGKEFLDYFGKLADLDKEITEAYRQMASFVKASGAKYRRDANLFVGLSELGAGLGTMLYNIPLGTSIAIKGLLTLGDEATANSLLRAKVEYDWHMSRTLYELAPTAPAITSETVTEEDITPEEQIVDAATINNLRRRSLDAQAASKNRGLSDSDVYSFIKQNYANDAPLRNVKV